MVGAPRAQSTLESQRKVNETGAVYKCNFNTNQCKPFVFDYEGNILSDNTGYTYSALNKDHQFLGAAMDGHGSEESKFVVCAPNIVTNTLNEHYLYHGVCYVSDNTVGDGPVNKYEVDTLRLRGKL